MQIRVLCDFLLRELLNNSDAEIDQAFKDYGSNYRDLYDNIIERINRALETSTAGSPSRVEGSKRPKA